ncbi:hypothetical protein [Cellulomonas shaoxiangyii]|uniref:Uncharacterized protein n=1 Tax=Cellulomonas shaoxiangyii TaxID=2566013 RepID=A0A4P7SIW4_9CELL|nr:hypothetical protein [Cellulomonas shaoxiangyii]QCB93026.1 hypothetical protein E5225_05085 [Cellulomonas shaoxiangyii]TGY85558.1 hypothetical protein E5226_05870 [Cellulomonas shaoxiangyii]
MRSHLPASVGALAGAVALLLTGCTGGGGDGAAPSDDETGPISAFFEQVGGSMDSEDGEAQQRRVEELVAACMAEEGFEYTPVEPMSAGAMGSDDAPEWDTLEFAEQYGYGATTGEELFGGTSEEYVDPNQEYVSAMSQTEQEAYYAALYGVVEEVEDPEAQAEVEYDWTTAGCQGAASHEVYEEGQVWDDPAMQELLDEMNTEYERLAEDDAVREAQSAWAECVADAGYDFATPDEASQSIYDEHSALMGYDQEVDPEADPATAAPPEPDEAKLAELREKEIALATADRRCQEETGYAKAQKDAQLAMETRLWDKYGEQLQAYADDRTAGADGK